MRCIEQVVVNNVVGSFREFCEFASSAVPFDVHRHPCALSKSRKDAAIGALTVSVFRDGKINRARLVKLRVSLV